MLLEMILDEKLDFGAANSGLLKKDEVIELKYMKPEFLRKRKFKKRLRENAVVKPRPVLPINEGETDLCVSLWQSVIVQALYDISGKGGNLERRMIRADGLAWFASIGSGNNESDFEYICQLANLSPTKIREVVREVREKGEEIIDGFNFRTIRRGTSGRKGRKASKKTTVSIDSLIQIMREI